MSRFSYVQNLWELK